MWRVEEVVVEDEELEEVKEKVETSKSPTISTSLFAGGRASGALKGVIP